ncbi:helix-turn-helix domain-containing protein [Actinoplanes sp. Pm04-4]|uniref:Helix-turn-helix domain-containing protein n=1 Tax=Paractinoplanes pyxinae TaxID=2997416 RepID=A0ABT4BGX0_9ACTN|nr:helix-turn-helix domain-containing protein [Actinoplanes pyxinae]MCY1145759.1 helix-turn-helix domain-containing protein [Actinoplanes pyxinae]
MRIELDTDDLDVACRALTDAYEGLRLAVAGDCHRLRLVRGRLGPVELRRTTFTMAVTGEGQPICRLGFARLRRGSVAHAEGGGFTGHEAGDVFLIAQPDEPYKVMADAPDVETVFIDQALLAEVSDSRSSCKPEPVRFTGRLPVSRRAAGLWRNAHAHVRDIVVDQSAADQPLLAGAAVRMLAATALSVFPNTGLRQPTVVDSRDAHSAALARALLFVDDNAHRDISEADIAGAARVSIRSLRLAFERHPGVTVADHLRRVRLALAHRDLSAADPTVTTVAAIAARWGFADEHKFDLLHRMAYGVAPDAVIPHD